VLDAEVAAGEIGYEDGLIRLLRSFLGDPEVSLPPAYDEVITREGNSIVERAGDYIAGGTDEAAKAEMQRLLDLIVPSTEQLEAYSWPAAANLGGPGLTRPVAQFDCAALWLAGFPLEGVSTYPCFEYTRTGSLACTTPSIPPPGGDLRSIAVVRAGDMPPPTLADVLGLLRLLTTTSSVSSQGRVLPGWPPPTVIRMTGGRPARF
jgi:hypothetical protein